MADTVVVVNGLARCWFKLICSILSILNWAIKENISGLRGHLHDESDFFVSFCYDFQITKVKMGSDTYIGNTLAHPVASSNFSLSKFNQDMEINWAKRYWALKIIR